MNSLPEALFFLLIIAIVVLGVAVLFYRKKRFSSGTIKKIQFLWQEIEGLTREHPEQAILKADKLLDFALGKAGYHGNLGDKLKKSEAVFRDINGVWSAHKLRNRIAHDVDAFVDRRQADSALKHFKRAFSDLGIPL